MRSAIVSLLVSAVAAWAPPAIEYTDTPALDNASVPASWAQMPLGNGLLAASVWVEPPGDLVAYLSSPTAYDELHQLIKLGRVRIRFGGAPFNDTAAFGEVLFLSNATLHIAGRGGFNARLWVDAHSPSLHVEGGASEDFDMSISTEIYRTDNDAGRAADVGGAWMCWAENVTQGRRSADVLLPPVAGSTPTVAWYHRNAPTAGVTQNSTLWASELTNQGLGSLLGRPDITNDTLTNNTFGVAVVRTRGGPAAVSADGTSLQFRSLRGRAAAVVLSHEVAAVPSAAEFETQLRDRAVRAAAQPAAVAGAAYANHSAWWSAYWAQSHVVVTATRDAAHNAKLISMQAAVQRYLSACEGRGDHTGTRGPGGIVKFNGAIFNTDPGPISVAGAPPHGPGATADTRDWGGATWFQNTRHSYWPMLASGDFEQLLPLFEMYGRALPLARARTELTMGHRGAYFPETMWTFGTWIGTNYGCPAYRAGVGSLAHSTVADCTFLRHYRTQGLELSALMLEAAAHAPSVFLLEADDAGAGAAPRPTSFARRTLLPVVVEVLRFFYEHYELNRAGEMVMRAQALETWQECVNPATDIAGLHWVVNRTLALPLALLPVDSDDRAMVLALHAQLLPVNKVVKTNATTGATFVDYCQWLTVETHNNVENPELYAVHPFPLYGRNFTDELPFSDADGTGVCGGANLATAIETYRRRQFHNPFNGSGAAGGPSIGEWQEGPQAARLGLADEAADLVQLRAAWGGATTGPLSRASDGCDEHQMRFPGFFGVLASDTNYFPDPEHLATMRTTLQWMLLQNDGRRILLFGGLPVSWDVDFRLHARENTVVEGRCKKGKLLNLTVTPSHRRKDVVIIGNACR